MKYIIRKAAPTDFEAIFFLIKEFAEFQQTADKVSITLEQMQADKNLFQCFVATDINGKIIGFSTFFFAYYSWSGKALNLDDLYVTQAFRKQGIGKMLLEEVIALARKEDCKKLRWQVSGWNTNAIAFYKKIGAIIDGTDINCDLYL